MKNHILSISLLMAFSPLSLFSAAGPQGPMNAAWFYDQNNPYAAANQAHQERDWKEAARRYRAALKSDNPGTQYDQNMARLNLAACQTAQGDTESLLKRASAAMFGSEEQENRSGWKAFDALTGIPEEKQLPNPATISARESILILSGGVGIGDRVHFLEAVAELRRRTDAQITLSVPGFLIPLFETAAQQYNITLVGDKAPQPETTYQTHMVGLIGHLQMKFSELSPEIAPYTASESTIARIRGIIDPLHAEGKSICFVIAGENRQATLIGGKQLPHDQHAHGRQLTPAAFEPMLDENPEMIILDGGTKDSRVTVRPDLQNRIVQLPPEEKAFDTYVALGALINQKQHRIVAIVSDQGPSNVFARACNGSVQKDNVAFVIPNPGEYDMRMEGEGTVYKQTLSECLVYKTKSPAVENQADTIKEIIAQWKARRTAQA